MARWLPTCAGTTVLLLAAVQASHGQAQGGTDFYQGKTLRIVISTGVAGGFGEYARLMGQAADSSLVKERGDANQFTVGVSASYRFDFTIR